MLRVAIVATVTALLVVIGACACLRWRARYPKLTRRAQAVGFVPLHALCTAKTARCAPPAGSHACCAAKLVEMAGDVTSLLGDKVFVLCGTVLGLVRHGGMIPWDDDLDMAILARDEPAFVDAIPHLEALGYQVKLHEAEQPGDGLDPARSGEQSGDTFSQPPYRYYCIEFSASNVLHVDVAVLQECEVEKDDTPVLVDASSSWVSAVVGMDARQRGVFKSWIFRRDEVLPPQAVSFMGVDLFAPRAPPAFLRRMYGNDWRTHYNRDNFVTTRTTPLMSASALPSTVNEAFGMAPALIVSAPHDKERLHHMLSMCDAEGVYAIGVNDERPSHEQAWRRAVRAALPTLILEGTAALPFDFRDVLGRLVAEVRTAVATGALPAALLVRLGRDGARADGVSAVAGAELLRRLPFKTGTWAYVVTPEAASALMSKKSRCVRSTDHVLRQFATDDYALVDAVVPNLEFRYALDDRHNVVQTIRYG